MTRPSSDPQAASLPCASWLLQRSPEVHSAPVLAGQADPTVLLRLERIESLLGLDPGMNTPSRRHSASVDVDDVANAAWSFAACHHTLESQSVPPTLASVGRFVLISHRGHL
jgi:hypothetical protein